MSVEAQKAKQVIIDEIKEKLDGAQSAVVIDYMGITVAEADAMRKQTLITQFTRTLWLRELLKEQILPALQMFWKDQAQSQSARMMQLLLQEL